MVWSGQGRPFYWQAVGEHFGHGAVLLVTRSSRKNAPPSRATM